MIQNVVHAGAVVQDFHQVGDFHRFKENGNLAFLEDGFHLSAGQAIAFHPSGTVSQIGLHIVVQTMKAFLFSDGSDFLPERQFCDFLRPFDLRRSVCLFRDQPCAISLDCSGNSALVAMATNK